MEKNNYLGSTGRQSLSDWFTPQNYPGETVVLAMPYRNLSNGARQPGPFYVYGYSFPLNSVLTMMGLTFVSNPNVEILAVTLVP